MAYSELVKNFNRIRDYMREFYVYGFKSREEFTGKSARSYDDERRRMESWLGEYMHFRMTPEGKNVFLTIDSRVTQHNPLYQAWKTKSFTDGDITLYFLLMDLLTEEEGRSLNEIVEKVDERLSVFEQPKYFDGSTIRKKLKEFTEAGLLVQEKQGKTLYYKRAKDFPMEVNPDVLNFFSEVAPCGVIGSFLLDRNIDLAQNRAQKTKNPFRFKHHYITGAIDSDILAQIFQAIQEKRSVILETVNRKKHQMFHTTVVPLKVFASVQNGRQYVMAYTPRNGRITAYRLDRIVKVSLKEKNANFKLYRERLEKMKAHLWGVSTQSRSGARMETVEFTVCYGKDEPHIHQRLEREKRCGKVEKLNDHSSRFYAEVYDATELIPWIRTFICRITEIHFSDPVIEADFQKDLDAMYDLYGIEGGDPQ